VAIQIDVARQRMETFRMECNGEIDRLEKVWAELRN
jgi:hypothetical protein